MIVWALQSIACGALSSSGGVFSGLHANGLLEVRLSRPFEAMDSHQLDGLEHALTSEEDAAAILLITSSAEARTRELAHVTQSVADRRRLAVREHGLHAFLQAAAENIPVSAAAPAAGAADRP